jgi:hypothetical protein
LRNSYSNKVSLSKNKVAFLVSVEDTTVPDYDPDHTQNGDKYRDNIEDLLIDYEFRRGNIKKLTNPTANEFLTSFENQIKSLKTDDFLIFYFYGHGGQVPDKSGDEKIDNKGDFEDETLVMKDNHVLDDEIYSILLKHKTKAKILFIIECCNSGTSIKLYKDEIIQHNKILEQNTKPTFDIIYIGATQDRTSVPSNLFNKTLINTIEDENYDNYIKFIKELDRRMFKRNISISIGLSMASKEFVNQQPFK